MSRKFAGHANPVNGHPDASAKSTIVDSVSPLQSRQLATRLANLRDVPSQSI
jgi:hypothetical protein